MIADLLRSLGGGLEAFLIRERDQWPLWIPVLFGSGIACWFIFGDPVLPALFVIIALIVLVSIALLIWRTEWRHLALLRLIPVAALLIAGGYGLIAARTALVAPVFLERPFYGSLSGRIEKREALSARGQVRLYLALPETGNFPDRVRLNLKLEHDRAEFVEGAMIRAQVRLMPPPPPILPGAYNFARRAWYEGIGASGSILQPPELLRQARSPALLAGAQTALSEHVRTRVSALGFADGAGAIGATLASGDRGHISDDDAEAMRRSGLAHLLSISGLHVSAVIFAIWLLVLKSLALFPALALRVRLPLVAAFMGALAGIGYTLLTGAQVPTIRACIGALLVLLALALGRDPLSMRLLAFAALCVLIIWPEALMGPSFQLSFAAVAAIIALHDLPGLRNLNSREEPGPLRRFMRFLTLLFITGLVVELTLIPIALYHFHKAGLYGALANLVAIPLTSLVIMPAIALALLLDLVGLGAPIWWIAGTALEFLLGLAHHTSSLPGAVLWTPTMAGAVFALFVSGGLWLMLWRSRARLYGLAPIALATMLMLLAPKPLMLITADGKHLALRSETGGLVFLREKMGDYNRAMLSENAGFEGDALFMRQWDQARCSRDFCSFPIRWQGRELHVLAGISRDYVPEFALAAACRRADIVIADRSLPRSCKPRLLRLDRRYLRQSGGLALYPAWRWSGEPVRVEKVATRQSRFPWYQK